MTNWYDSIVSDVKTALENVFAKKTDLNGKENNSNKVTLLDNSTNHYPSTSAVQNGLKRKATDYENCIVLKWSGQNFVSSFRTDVGGSYHITGTNMIVDWGDGTSNEITSGQRFTHDYSTSGTYIITISGDSITKLGDYCFATCNLTNISIPSTVTSLGTSCFSACLNLKSVVIPSSITTVDSYCFSHCESLEIVKFKNTTPPTLSNSNVWNYVPTTCKIYVPSSSLNTYKSTSNYLSSTYTYIGYADEVIDSVTDNDTRGVTSNAVYDGLSGKVDKVTDIVDNLTTDDATKVLSAKQGKLLKDEIGDIHTLIYGTGGNS